ncbi:hypothetical protein HDU96_008935, partial [Phlyctochytrium bullatum]
LKPTENVTPHFLEAGLGPETAARTPPFASDATEQRSDDQDDGPKCREDALRLGTQFMDTTVGYAKMPSWYHDNQYIRTGYRRIQFTYKGCVRSLLYLHNETGNIYTHLIGTVLFFVLMGVSFGRTGGGGGEGGVVGNGTAAPTATVTVAPTATPSATPTAVASSTVVEWSYASVIPILSNTTAFDITVMCVFLVSAVLCLGLSTTYHLCCCHSMEVSKAWNKADYVGIVFLIVGSFIPSVFFGFYCSPALQLAYIGTMAVLGLATAIATLSKRLSHPKYRNLRTTLFLSLGLAGLVPLVHSMVLYGTDFAYKAMSLQYLGIMGCLYVLGALIFASRVPERWWPGKFDLWLTLAPFLHRDTQFHSHQIFHCLVVAAAIVHYVGLAKAYRFWHDGSAVCGKIP